MKKYFIIIFSICLFDSQLIGQTPGFAGIWVLKERQTISGPDYINGIPKEMVLAVTQDTLSVKRTYKDAGNNEYVYH